MYNKIELQYIKEKDIIIFQQLRNGIMGQTMNLPGKGGRKISVAAYRLSQKVVGFNYLVCKAATSFREIEEMEENLILPTFRKLKFVDCNKPFWRKLMYKAFVRAKSGCDKWHDYEMSIAPYETDKPIYYEFTACPAAEFAIRHGLTDIMPALCNVDFASMELLHARLIRTNTCVNGCRCDYTICGDQDPYVKEHPEYRDEAGFRRNK